MSDKFCPFSSGTIHHHFTRVKYLEGGQSYTETSNERFGGNRLDGGGIVSSCTCLEERCAVWVRVSNMVGFCGLIGANARPFIKEV